MASRRRSRRGLVCIARGDSCYVSPRVLSSPPSPIFVRWSFQVALYAQMQMRTRRMSAFFGYWVGRVSGWQLSAYRAGSNYHSAVCPRIFLFWRLQVLPPIKDGNGISRGRVSAPRRDAAAIGRAPAPRRRPWRRCRFGDGDGDAATAAASPSLSSPLLSSPLLSEHFELEN